MKSSIWKFESDLTQRLLVWSYLSVPGGLFLWLTAKDFGRGFGIQAVFWGLVDMLIALFGTRSADRRMATADPQREANFIRRILWINFGLDVFYILGGVWMILSWQRDFWQGTGWGIVFQGAFLFLFDLYHALNVPVEVL